MIPQDNAQIAVRHRVLGVQLNLGQWGKTCLKHEGSVTQSAEVIGYKLSSHKPMPYRQYDKYIQIYTV
jgi:hypothetical protein